MGPAAKKKRYKKKGGKWSNESCEGWVDRNNALAGSSHQSYTAKKKEGRDANERLGGT